MNEEARRQTLQVRCTRRAKALSRCAACTVPQAHGPRVQVQSLSNALNREKRKGSRSMAGRSTEDGQPSRSISGAECVRVMLCVVRDVDMAPSHEPGGATRLPHAPAAQTGIDKLSTGRPEGCAKASLVRSPPRCVQAWVGSLERLLGSVPAHQLVRGSPVPTDHAGESGSMRMQAAAPMRHECRTVAPYVPPSCARCALQRSGVCVSPHGSCTGGAIPDIVCCVQQGSSPGHAPLPDQPNLNPQHAREWLPGPSQSS
jgi:hypothetical protein